MDAYQPGWQQEEGHTKFLLHLPSAVLAFIFIVGRIRSAHPFPSSTVKYIEFCVPTNQSFSTTCWAYFSHDNFKFIFREVREKSQFV